MLFKQLVTGSNGKWDDYINHQFVHELMNGTLSPHKFKHYIEQDFQYLEAYNKCFKVIERECENQFEQMYFKKSIAVETELSMYHQYEIEFPKLQSSITTMNYVNYLNQIMVDQDHLAKLVAIAPCIIGYGMIGQKLAQIDLKQINNYFKPWIEVYQSTEFTWAVKDLIDIINKYQVSEKELLLLQQIFNNVCQFEIAFFNQALAISKPQVLTIAGSDCSGGAGIQADIKSISANGGYAASVITAITAQNTQGVSAIYDLKPEVIRTQLKAIFNDLSIKVIKIGMIANKEIMQLISEEIPNNIPVVLDPVMVAKDKTLLITEDAINELQHYLLPKAYLITPNIEEAQVLLREEITDVESMQKACIQLAELGCENILLKGGHLTTKQLVDVLYADGKFYLFEKTRIETKDTHGTGCSLSSAIATNLAKGDKLKSAVEKAINYVYNGIVLNYQVGLGCSPINHFHEKCGGYYE